MTVKITILKTCIFLLFFEKLLTNQEASPSKPATMRQDPVFLALGRLLGNLRSWHPKPCEDEEPGQMWKLQHAGTKGLQQQGVSRFVWMLIKCFVYNSVRIKHRTKLKESFSIYSLRIWFQRVQVMKNIFTLKKKRQFALKKFLFPVQN